MPFHMPAPHSTVEAAIRRWHAKGLVDESLARALLEESGEEEGARGQRQGQLVLAGVGAVLLFAAAAVLTAWAWPHLGDVARSLLLFALGAASQVLAAFALREDRWTPVGYGLEAVGLGLLLSAFMYSELAWPDGSAGALAVAACSLLAPLAVLPLGFRRDPVLAALGTIAFFGFLAVALERATPLSADAIVWVLDGALVLLLLLTAGRIVPRPDRLEPWETAVLTTGLFGGLVLVLITVLGPLDMERWAPLPVDLWWLIVTTIVLAAIRLEWEPLPRSRLESLLGLCILLGVGLVFWTVDGAFRAHYVVTSLAVAGLGVGGILLALGGGLLQLLPASALAVVVAAWHLAIQAGGALPAALALGFTAVVFFWTSGRMGRARGAAAPEQGSG